MQVFSTSFCREPHTPISAERVAYLNVLIDEIGLQELRGKTS